MSRVSFNTSLFFKIKRRGACSLIRQIIISISASKHCIDIKLTTNESGFILLYICTHQCIGNDHKIDTAIPKYF